MLDDLKSKSKVVKCVNNNLQKLIKTLLEEEVHFSVFCYINNVKFDPSIPKDIDVDLKSLTIFALLGHTFSTAKIKDDYLEFEAGFGADDFESLVMVPLDNILQVLIGDNVIFINPFSNDIVKEEKEDELALSMKAILSNPKNKNILKK